MRKSIFALPLCAALLASCSSNESNDNPENETSAFSYSDDELEHASTYVGTYEVNDGVHTWEIELKSDETLTMNVKGSSKSAYGVWDTKMSNYVRIAFNKNIHPILSFPGGEESLEHPYIEDGYLYKDASKDPNNRLPVTKVR